MAGSSPVVPAVRLGGYAELTAEIRSLGLLRRRPWFYAGYFALNIITLTAVVCAMVVWRDSWWLLLLAPVLAIVSTQIAFFGHDVGHRQVIRDQRLSRILGTADGNLLGGFSYSWWVSKHNAHHAHPNDLESDPDVSPGAFVFDSAQTSDRRGLAAWITRHQAALFFPFLLGEAINLHVSSVRSVLRPNDRHLWELVLLLVHFVAVVVLIISTMTIFQGLAFFLIYKGLQGIYLGCSFAPSHKGMPILSGEEALDPLLRQVLTSRNITGGRVLDVVFGGLNHQIEHHLFPSMPRPNLRHAQPVVERFCAEHSISYAQTSAFASYGLALRHLRDVGAELRARGGSES